MKNVHLKRLVICYMFIFQASASSIEWPYAEEDDKAPATCTLKVPYGTSLRQPTKEDLDALPTEEIGMTPAPQIPFTMGPSSRVKVVYALTKEPLTLQKVCDGLRAGHVFSIAYSSLPAVYNLFSYIPEGTTAEGEQRASYFKAVMPGFSLEDWQWISASEIFQSAIEFIEWPHHACLRMRPIEGSLDTYMMPTLRSPAPSCTRMLAYLHARGLLLASQLPPQGE